uniref:RING-H2 finger protein ATL29-like n=1 Tax=Nicotiana sylvestris TaxID=4096 RepID=A0A1U7VD39_NICSY|nr:PREDICTED: RING-H2 finger protein ATL29-like [Nicotiana sylvestris]
MDFHFEPLATVTAAATTLFLICTIKFRWFRPDNHLPPPFSVEDNYDDDGGSCCAVCLNDVSGGDMCRKLPKCDHVFHLECVDAWLQSNWTCPLCRRQITDGTPKQQRENTIFSLLFSRCEDFLAKINAHAEQLMTVLFDSGVFVHP